MEIIARFLYCLSVYFGWLVTPIYYLLSLRSFKPLPKTKQPDILNQSAISLARKIRNKQISSEIAVKAFIERCRDVNPMLNAVVEDRYSAAVEEAKMIDKLLALNNKTVEELEKETPLLGVPVTIKESCGVAGMCYSVGATLRRGVTCEKDGIAVSNLRKAGAIPIVITNTPELCTSLETYNGITGYTSNPYDQSRSPGGSSGGEAALISSGASILGIGSDFGGSIRVPCFFTGIFGHKPTGGVVPNKGHYPDNPSKVFQKFLNIGPLCRYAEDMKFSLKIIAGENASVLNLDTPVNLRDLKIFNMEDKGFSLTEISVNSDITNAIKKATEHFKSYFGCQSEKIQLNEIENSCEICAVVTSQLENIREVLSLKGLENESSLFVDCVKAVFNLCDYSLNMLLIRFITDTVLFIPNYKKSKYVAMKNELQKKLSELLGENGVLFFPTFSEPAFYRYQLLWKVSSLGYPMIINVIGFPSTHVPMGLNKNGLPIGFQVVAAPNQDRLCLAVAEELERVFGGWVPPPETS